MAGRPRSRAGGLCSEFIRPVSQVGRGRRQKVVSYIDASTRKVSCTSLSSVMGISNGYV